LGKDWTKVPARVYSRMVPDWEMMKLPGVKGEAIRELVEKATTRLINKRVLCIFDRRE
jgi:hypothetical protein